MKINEVKVVDEYAALDNPTSSYQAVPPRRVKVLEITVVPERDWSGVTGAVKWKNVRKVKVKVLDRPTSPGRYYEPLRAAKLASTLVVEARKLAAPWEDVSEGVRQQAEQEQARVIASAALNKRLNALLGRSRRSYGSVDVRLETSLHVSGREVEKLLALAEKGKTQR